MECSELLVSMKKVRSASKSDYSNRQYDKKYANSKRGLAKTLLQ